MRQLIVCCVSFVLMGCAHNVGNNYVLRDGMGIAVLDLRTNGRSYYVNLKPTKIFTANKSDSNWKVFGLKSGLTRITRINDKYGKSGVFVVTVTVLDNVGCFDVVPGKINIVDTLEISPGLTNLSVRENYDEAMAFLKNQYPGLLERYKTTNQALRPLLRAWP